MTNKNWMSGLKDLGQLLILMKDTQHHILTSNDIPVSNELDVLTSHPQVTGASCLQKGKTLNRQETVTSLNLGHLQPYVANSLRFQLTFRPSPSAASAASYKTVMASRYTRRDIRLPLLGVLTVARKALC